MALVFYVTNYATKVEDPIWKRVAAAADLRPATHPADPVTGEEAAEGGVAIGSSSADDGGGDGAGNKTRQFLMKVANRVFTERTLSQVEVVADLLGYPVEYRSSSGWAYLNVSVLYWHVFRRWSHLRRESGKADGEDSVDESVIVEEAGQWIGFAEAYAYRGDVLRGCLYDYVSLVKLQRAGKDGVSGAWGEVPFDAAWADGKQWVQVLRRPGKHATVCLDGYLSKDFERVDDESCHHRAAVQHLALFVPWENFLAEQELSIKETWMRARRSLSPRISCLVDNVQLLQRSAEDARRDAKQWAATAGDIGGSSSTEVDGSDRDGDEAASAYEPNDVGIATRLVDVPAAQQARAKSQRGRRSSAEP